MDLAPPRRLSSVTVTLSPRNTLVAIYYAGAVVLILVGAVLWATGHGTGDPYLTLGIVLALAPLVVRWVLALLGRN
jgi:hypothetical protein